MRVQTFYADLPVASRCRQLGPPFNGWSKTDLVQLPPMPKKDEGIQFLQKLGVDSMESLNKDQMEQIMNKYDVNGDGHIDKAEFIKFLIDLFSVIGQEPLSTEDMEFLYQDTDKDGSGYVDKHEFLAMFDSESSSSAAAAEPSGIAFLQKLGVESLESLSKSQMVEIMNKYDVNGDGRIDKTEFVKFLTDLFKITGTEEPSADEIDALYLMSDSDGSGFVDKQEFLSMFD
jgi:Ca2+-binding EF-hand superfamily protein